MHPTLIKVIPASVNSPHGRGGGPRYVVTKRARHTGPRSGPWRRGALGVPPTACVSKDSPLVRGSTNHFHTCCLGNENKDALHGPTDGQVRYLLIFNKPSQLCSA